MNDTSGRFVAFEGVDSTGKTTLCNRLCDLLTSENQPIRRFHFPGKDSGTLGELVYKIHHNHEPEFGISQIDPCALQLLHIAAHIDVIQSPIKQAITDGYWIVLDRFWWSTYVYGLVSGVSNTALTLMIELEKHAWGSIRPDIMFFIDSAVPLRCDEIDVVQ